MDFFGDFFADLGNLFFWIFKHIKATIVIIVVAVIVIFVVIYISKHNASDIDDYIYEVTADEILGEYKENNIQAELKYEDNIIKIGGSIDSITGDDDRIEILLNDSILGYRVILVFTDTNEIEQIAVLNVDDYINVIGKVGEFDNGLISNILTINRCNYEE
ncbi:MAG: hypothetical protein ABII85_03770 [Bacillota bacterium]